jgi:hypothetical protein
MTKFTTADADRLLGLADQFMEDWALSAVEGGKRDTDYEERNAEWEEIRPLLMQAPALYTALEDLLGDKPDVQGGVCQHCGRDYLASGHDDMLTGDCPADDCPAHGARAAIAKARGQQ